MKTGLARDGLGARPQEDTCRPDRSSFRAIRGQFVRATAAFAGPDGSEAVRPILPFSLPLWVPECGQSSQRRCNVMVVYFETPVECALPQDGKARFEQSRSAWFAGLSSCPLHAERLRNSLCVQAVRAGHGVTLHLRAGHRCRTAYRRPPRCLGRDDQRPHRLPHRLDAFRRSQGAGYGTRGIPYTMRDMT